MTIPMPVTADITLTDTLIPLAKKLRNGEDFCHYFLKHIFMSCSFLFYCMLR